jgi:tetratricopeptide (TPR) repeat protein
MPVSFYCKESVAQMEYSQIKKICELIERHFFDSSKDIRIFVNMYLRSHNQCDCLILTSTGFLIVECKNYQGDIFGTELDEWYAITNTGKKIVVEGGSFNSPFEQVRGLRLKLCAELAQKFNEFGEEEGELKNGYQRQTRGALFFNDPSEWKDRHNIVDHGVRYWFDVITENRLIEKIEQLLHERNGKFDFEESFKEKIIALYSLKPYNWKENKIIESFPIPSIGEKISISYDTLLTNAQLAFEKMDFLNALNDYESILKQKNDDATIFKKAGICRFYLQDYAGALIYWSRANTIIPDDPELCYWIGSGYKKKEEYREALFWYEKSIEKDNNDFWVKECIFFMNNELFEYAITACDHAFYLNPHDPWPLLYKSHALYREHRFLEALGTVESLFEWSSMAYKKDDKPMIKEDFLEWAVASTVDNKDFQEKNKLEPTEEVSLENLKTVFGFYHTLFDLKGLIFEELGRYDEAYTIFHVLYTPTKGDWWGQKYHELEQKNLGQIARDWSSRQNLKDSDIYDEIDDDISKPILQEDDANLNFSKLSATTFYKLSKWGNETKKLDGYEREFSYNMGVRIENKTSAFSEKQVKFAINLIKKARKMGFNLK